jgi:serine/threonine protein kinase
VSVSLPEAIGKYPVIAEIDSGGMGTVYLARDPESGRHVAIKVIRADLNQHELRERFEQEARSLERVRHPNIVAIYESGTFEGQPYIAMEYVAGKSLRKAVCPPKRRKAKPRKRMKLERKLRIVDEICAGMAHAHQAKVVHRDLKPDNIMLGKDKDGGNVKILDFGIARSLQTNASQLTNLFGSVNYMAPERFLGLVDHRSDIFSIGAILYELLSNQMPFDGDSPGAVMGQIMLKQPTPLATLCPGINPAIVAIVERALEKEADARYQDLGEMRQDIKRVMAAPGDVVPVVPNADPPRREFTPMRYAAAATLTAASALMIAFGADSFFRPAPAGTSGTPMHTQASSAPSPTSALAPVSTSSSESPSSPAPSTPAPRNVALDQVADSTAPAARPARAAASIVPPAPRSPASLSSEAARSSEAPSSSETAEAAPEQRADASVSGGAPLTVDLPPLQKPYVPYEAVPAPIIPRLSPTYTAPDAVNAAALPATPEPTSISTTAFTQGSLLVGTGRVAFVNNVGGAGFLASCDDITGLRVEEAAKHAVPQRPARLYLEIKGQAWELDDSSRTPTSSSRARDLIMGECGIQ